MNSQDFDFIRKLLQERSGVVLDNGKEYLVESRLTPLVREMNLAAIADLVQHLRTNPFSLMHKRIVEAMVTTETSFFRDHAPFEALRTTVLPDLIRLRASQRKLSIWCAACSTGQEPYSLAMLLHEHFPDILRWDLTLIATDISREMLNRSREGKYNQIEVNRGLPAALLVKHFQRHGMAWQINESLRKMIDFRELNLTQPWPLMPRFDLILLRNVMIYFDVETKKQILGRASRILQPDGYLLLGGAETPLNLDDSYRRIESHRVGFYQLGGNPR